MSEGLRLELEIWSPHRRLVRPGDFATNFHESTRRIGSEWRALRPNLEQGLETAIDKNMARAQKPNKVAELLASIGRGPEAWTGSAVGECFRRASHPAHTV